MADNVISLEKAQSWALRWRENPSNIVKAFLIPHEDFAQLLARPSVDDIRAYVGVDDSGTHKLMLVGVDKYGSDLIDADKKEYIYDFTQPCPAYCDMKSPLYNLELNE